MLADSEALGDWEAEILFEIEVDVPLGDGEELADGLREILADGL